MWGRDGHYEELEWKAAAHLASGGGGATRNATMTLRIASPTTRQAPHWLESDSRRLHHPAHQPAHLTASTGYAFLLTIEGHESVELRWRVVQQ